MSTRPAPRWQLMGRATALEEPAMTLATYPATVNGGNDLPRKPTVHHVFANRSNIGDWLSARAIQQHLGSLDVEVAEYLIDDIFVEETIERLGAAVSPDDMIVIGGGGLFMDYFTLFWEALPAIAADVPYCIWGVGYCDLKWMPSRTSAELLARVVRNSRVCVVRDEMTRRHLTGCDLSSPVPCPSMSIVEPAPLNGHGLLLALNDDAVSDEVHAAMSAVAIDFAERSERPHWTTSNCVPDGDEGALYDTLGLYAASDVIVSSRLHGVIIALAMGRKAIAVSGDHKVEAFMEAAGLGEWVCDADRIDSLASKLGAIQEQVRPAAFFEQARHQNQLVAEQVRALVRVAAA